MHCSVTNTHESASKLIYKTSALTSTNSQVIYIPEVQWRRPLASAVAMQFYNVILNLTKNKHANL